MRYGSCSLSASRDVLLVSCSFRVEQLSNGCEEAQRTLACRVSRHCLDEALAVLGLMRGLEAGSVQSGTAPSQEVGVVG
jgi:hypothetical protein